MLFLHNDIRISLYNFPFIVLECYDFIILLLTKNNMLL